MSRRSLQILLAALLVSAPGVVANGERQALRPADTGVALVNPGMGWVAYFYSNLINAYGTKLEPADTLDDWPGLAVVYLRVPWAFLEPEEGRFNWALLDTPAQRWIAKGKKVAFRITCSENWMRYATPEWVRAAGAHGVNYEFGTGPAPDGRLWDPDFGDPVFLQKLENFLTAMARRYDGNPDVAFLDIGSFGLWGEGHTLMSSQLTEERTREIVQRHMALHARLFPRTLLALNDDVEGHDKPEGPFPLMESALQQGITFRDDSIMVQAPPRSWYHAQAAALFWPTLPVILEHEHYGPSVEKGAWGDGSRLLQAVEEHHASYLSIHWWPREELEANQELVAKINLRLGYRLQLREISWPAEIRQGEPFVIDTAWANVGVAPCLPGGFWAITLKDEAGGIVSVHVAEDLDLAKLPVADPDKAVAERSTGHFTLGRILHDPAGDFAPAVKPGVCDVFISVGRRDGTPVIALPLENDDGQRRYKIGSVRIFPPVDK